MSSPASDRRTFLKSAIRLCILAGLGALAAGLVSRRAGSCAGQCASCGRLAACDLPQAGAHRAGRTR